MRKGFLFSIVVLASFCASALATGGDMGVGTEPLTDGSVAYPYLIEDLADFDEFAGDSSYWATGVRTKLMTDIDLSGRTYRTAVVAKDTDGSTFQFDGPVFKGKFNGNGFRTAKGFKGGAVMLPLFPGNNMTKCVTDLWHQMRGGIID